MFMNVVGSGSSGNCYILQNDKEALLIECGCKPIDVKKALNFNVSKIVGVIASHVHADHFGYAKDYVCAGIRTIAPEECWNEKSAEWWFQYGERFDNTRGAFKVGNFTIQPFPNRTPDGKWLHNNSDGTECPCYGFWIYHREMGKMVYASDTECIVQKFKGINHFLIEANYSQDMVDRNSAKFNHQVQGHMSIDTACEFLKANKSNQLRTVTLCHLSGTASNSSKFLSKAKQVIDCDCYIAQKGLEVRLDENLF